MLKYEDCQTRYNQYCCFVFHCYMYGFALPSTVRVTRTINIDAPQDSLYKYVGILNNWELWMEGINANTVHFMSSQTVEKK